MQIELIGCTSAGKSNLIKNILRSNHHDGFSLVTSYDFVLKWAHLDWIKNHLNRMLCLNLIALFACLFTWRKNLEFYRFVIGVILRLPSKVGVFERLKIARIAARNVGIYEIVCRYSSSQQVVLADEGTLHIAHYLFVHVSVEPNMSEFATFIQLVSLPDVAVYIKQPKSILIARTTARKHKRIPEDASDSVDRFIQHGLAVFENLVSHSSLESRLLVVDGGEGLKPSWNYLGNRRLAFARKIIGFGIDAGGRERLQTNEA